MWDFSTRHDRLLDARTVTILRAVRYSRLGDGLKGFSTNELAARLGLPPTVSVEDALQFAQEAAREAASEASRDEDDDRYLDGLEWFRPPLPTTKRLRRRIANYGLLDTLIFTTLTLPPLAGLLVWLAS
ncbi:MAG: hypothetical protein ACKO0W_09915 [Planctomycetota bacterium]